MIDRETADEAAALISTVIAELVEQIHEEAVVMERGDLPAMAGRAARLGFMGDDVRTLAAALGVLARQGRPAG